LIKMIILEENFKWHLEAFASELFVFYCTYPTWNKRVTKQKSSYLSPIFKQKVQ